MKTKINSITLRDISNKRFTPSDKKYLAGFTFVEIILTVAILASGLLFINEGYLRVWGGLHHLDYRNFAESLIAEKLWETEDQLRIQDTTPQTSSTDTTQYDNREYQWERQLTQLDEQGYLYQAVVSVTWREGIRDITYTRNAYISK